MLNDVGRIYDNNNMIKNLLKYVTILRFGWVGKTNFPKPNIYNEYNANN